MINPNIVPLFLNENLILNLYNYPALKSSMNYGITWLCLMIPANFFLMLFVKHNLFQQSKQSRTIDLNTTDNWSTKRQRILIKTFYLYTKKPNESS